MIGWLERAASRRLLNDAYAALNEDLYKPGDDSPVVTRTIERDGIRVTITVEATCLQKESA